ncbi:hypothetical protein [Leptothoe spongobia]|uniref:Uncharacterized protein n=1 Tax=Leptothoe spongobia TAU-MAC 1115 TaxID=1967444 RepID=A0A947GEV3_9CYAN|nr:hypothetical protein [Leptothoe spongobia]MBT9314065.1 hypothetical protein [Leptothoe spongobia TAU-MAC 1115]
MGKLIYSAYTSAHLLLLAVGIYLLDKSPNQGTVILLLVLGGLVYDNLIITVGDTIGEGQYLKFLNQLRYWCHGLFSPLLLVVTLQILKIAEIVWVSHPLIYPFTWALAIGLVLIEVLTRMTRLTLRPIVFSNTLRYKEVVPSKEIPTILVISLMIMAGILLWQQVGFPWLFLGSLTMLLGSGVPPTTVFGPAIGSGVEIILMASLVASQLLL